MFEALPLDPALAVLYTARAQIRAEPKHVDIFTPNLQHPSSIFPRMTGLHSKAVLRDDLAFVGGRLHNRQD